MLNKKIKGTVVEGLKLGKKLGFPTANVEYFGKVKEEHGVYVASIKVSSEVHYGIAHFGPRAIFEQTVPLLEMYIFDFDRNIYGKEVEITLMDFIRPTMSFPSIDEMIVKINNDCEKARKYLRNHHKSRQSSKGNNAAGTKKRK